MRLVDIETLRLEEFTDTDSIPKYAILSHTWGDQEVSYQQFKRPTSRLRSTKGYRKIEKCCTEVRRWGLRYVWIDTCCINKSSSSELSEAINSMFRWYAGAAICLAYLSDVDSGRRDDRDVDRQIRRSRYFKRGWTLQELIAPKKLEFYDRFWVPIGTKKSMSRLIEHITGIAPDAFLHKSPLSRYSVACRMSWAAVRQTTRVEDIAYCLLGIFDINMPLLYGEGPNAFRRLQEEIINESDDQTIFAWENIVLDRPFVDKGRLHVGVLAQHPAQFRNSRDFSPAPYEGGSYSITNKGLLIEMPLIEYSGRHLAVLACYDSDRLLIALPVAPFIVVDGTDGHSVINTGMIYGREQQARLQVIHERAIRGTTLQSIYLLKKPYHGDVSKRWASDNNGQIFARR